MDFFDYVPPVECDEVTTEREHIEVQVVKNQSSKGKPWRPRVQYASSKDGLVRATARISHLGGDVDIVQDASGLASVIDELDQVTGMDDPGNRRSDTWMKRVQTWAKYFGSRGSIPYEFRQDLYDEFPHEKK